MDQHKLKYLAPALGLVMAACGGGSDNQIDGEADDGGESGTDYNQLVIDARAETQYLNLATGEVVSSDGDWDLAFNRTSVQLNSGASGNGRVAGAVGDEQAEFYDAAGDPDLNKFVGATADGELDHMKSSFSVPESWTSDDVVYAFGDGWSVYGDGGVISEVPDIGYLVRSAEGDSYARMRILDFNFPTRTGGGIESFNLEFEVQVAGTTQLSGSTVSFTQPAEYDGGDACFDFDTGVAVDCATSETWDVLIGFSGREWYLKTNSGPSGSGQGGALGPIPWAELSAYTSATIDNATGESLVRAYAPDSTGGLFAASSWYAYNLQGAHKLWPNFRVYLIDSDSEDASAPVYAMQIINYYGSDGNSGQPEIRWKEINLTTGEN
ncbi:HmuY family protein [Marinobacter sp. 1_MG-2023]|uniref:HmuY family protein n=1 Tax=Marinobacter sp. 1_MG-2023 TaxID=3062627 RepID=UPI0026E2935A|nr:HmuY family protein [Marinobacter sp. 1_MG-2023]MDO6822699.1 HmuY family protein [Marinobacter sp. 1_MG-2023]